MISTILHKWIMKERVHPLLDNIVGVLLGPGCMFEIWWVEMGLSICGSETRSISHRPTSSLELHLLRAEFIETCPMAPIFYPPSSYSHLHI
jgi:hypothetical protein